MDYQYKTKHVFDYYSHFKPLHQPKWYGDLIYNRLDAHIFVMDDNDIEPKNNLKKALKTLWWAVYFGISLKNNPIKLKMSSIIYIY